MTTECFWTQTRDIPKTPQYPNLSKEEEDILENIIFRPNDEITNIDALFVFGARHHMNEQKSHICHIIEQWYTKKIILSGGIVNFVDREMFYEAEALVMKKLIENEVKNTEFSHKIHIDIEDRSTNSCENVSFSNDLWYFKNIKSLGFICAEHVARRDFAYLKKFLPNITIHQFAIPYTYNESTITKETWRKSEFSKESIRGEYLRLQKYGEEMKIFDIEDIKTESEKLAKYR